MCFNANVSFAAGSVLAITGVAAIIKTKERIQLPFASIPLIFSLQQFSEGVIWLSFSPAGNSSSLSFFNIVFLFFAQLIWPAWTPFSILLLEKETKQKKILYALLVCGVSIAAFNAWNLFSSAVSAEIRNHHIYYVFGSQSIPLWTTGLFYFMATVVSPFVSTAKYMKLLGAGIFASFLFSEIFFKENVVSVWCFFAALISAIVYLIIKSLPENNSERMK